MSSPKPFEEVQPVLEAMVSHRRRVVAQIAGTPSMALNAALNHGFTELILDDPLTPPAPAWRAWIEKRAADSFIKNELYKILVPWGREEAEARERAAYRKKRAESWKDEAEAKIAEEQTRPGVKDQEFLVDQDRAFLEGLVTRGGLLSRPKLHSFELKSQGPFAMTPLLSQGWVVMPSDRLGDYVGNLSSLPKEAFATLSKKIHEARPPEHDKFSIYRRWKVLIHEVAHCDYAQIADPFRPTLPGWKPEASEAVNRWITGKPATGSRQASTLLNENHSDALAAMLLLEATGHDPEALRVVQVTLEDRYRTRDHLEVLGKKGPMRERGGFVNVHATEWTLKRVLDDIENWKGLPPSQLREKALEYASNGLVDFLNPQRKLSNGKTIGNDHIRNFLASEPTSRRLLTPIGMASVSHALGEDVQTWLGALPPSSPSTAVIQKGFAQVLPALEAALDQPLYEGSEFSLRETACNNPSRASQFIDNLVAQHAQVLAPQSPDLASLNEAYKQDLPIMEQAFGVKPALSFPVFGGWRKSREAAIQPPLPHPEVALSSSRPGLR